MPYDPARFSLGVGELAVLVLLVALAGWTWWVLHLRRVSSDPGPAALGASAGLLAVASCLVVWIFNPYLALVLVPLTHLTAVLGTGGRRPAALAIPVKIVAALPLVATVVYVASALDWGSSAPWQLAVLASGGGLPLPEVAGSLLVLASSGAVLTAALATARRSSQGSDPNSGVVPPTGA